MGEFNIKKGLDLPITGSPHQKIDQSSKKINSVGLICADYPYLKPLLDVKVGGQVRVGDPLFLDNKSKITFTSIAGGTIKAINRGERRKLLSIEVALSEKEEYKEFNSYSYQEALVLSRDAVKKQLIDSGAWTFFRTRPFSKIPSPTGNFPRSIFVTAIDTSPLAPRPELIIQQNKESFSLGLDIIAKLTTPVHVCVSPEKEQNLTIPHGKNNDIVFHFFSGKHPAGLVGTHIHHIDPIITINDEVWHIGYQDVIAIGKLFSTGKLFLDKYVALAGPQVASPRIIKTRKGANLLELTQGELLEGENRIISGSPLYGEPASAAAVGFLGNFTNTISVLKEDRRRFFHGFLTPGFNDFSVKPIMASRLLGDKKLFSFGTLLNGSVRDVVPIGSYESVMPLDLEISYLVRSLLSGDTETAEKLGALELDEEDLSLVTFACPGKNDIGKALNNVLYEIEKENN